MTKTNMLTITFLALIITFTVVSGVSLSDQVHQTPPEMVVAIKSGATVTLNCSHSIKDYDRILWYKQQRNDKQLKLLGNIYSTTANPEKGMDVEMSGSADQDKTASLTIQNISVESSAVYFCAARFHNAAY
ncbi:unnamed protein product [Boreogadus saida]